MSSYKITEPLGHVANVRSAEFRQAIGALVAPGFTPGNAIRILNNGNEIFPAMLASIRSARRTIDLETLVFYQGEIPQAFAEALEERASIGVQVKVILDAVGAKKSRPYHAALRQAGVQLEFYHPLFALDLRRYNYRTHRKLLIVDGKSFREVVGVSGRTGKT